MNYIDRELELKRGMQRYGSISNSKDFDETKIKRDSDGKFSSKGGSEKKSEAKKPAKDLASLQEEKYRAFEAFQEKKMEYAEKTGHSDGFYIENPTEYRELYGKMREAQDAWDKEYEKQNPPKKKKK